MCFFNSVSSTPRFCSRTLSFTNSPFTTSFSSFRPDNACTPQAYPVDRLDSCVGRCRGLLYKPGVTMSESNRAFELNAPSSSGVGNGAVTRGGKRVGARGDHIMPFYMLFMFADGVDTALGAAANGAVLLLMTMLFGHLIGAASPRSHSSSSTSPSCPPFPQIRLPKHSYTPILLLNILPYYLN
jgi:hypothetical protein